jgi:glycosyltransferase involved in cell wall biosynthesis
LERPYLSVVVPAYNEESRIAASLGELVGYLASQDYSWELLVIDDGSTDATAAVARQRAGELESTIRVETVPHAGKGWAVRHGMLASGGELRFMCDADLAMPVKQIGAFVERMADGYDIVAGSRQKEGARRFDEPFGRHVMGRAFNKAVRLMAVGGFEDTQCGFKCFKGEVADELFGLQRTRGFGFDVEVLYLATRKGLRVLEMPIDWRHQSSSKVRPILDSFLMLRDTALVRLRGMPRDAGS